MLLGNVTYKEIINEINALKNTNISKIEMTIDNMSANTPKDIIVTDTIPNDANKVALVSFSSDTNSIAIDAGIVLLNIDVNARKFTFQSNDNVTQAVKVIITFI